MNTAAKVRFTVELTETDCKHLDDLCRKYGFESKAVAIRKALRLLHIACRTESEGGYLTVRPSGSNVPTIIQVLR